MTKKPKKQGVLSPQYPVNGEPMQTKRIWDLPGQTFMPGMEPEKKPEQIEIDFNTSKQELTS